MRFKRRVSTMIAGILLVLMAIGCDAPADSAGVATIEQTFVDATVVESSEAEDAEQGLVAEEAASAASSESAFGEVGEVDDPFAAIGPAFSGLGFQTHSSACDPFEDEYGTCL
ncbi:MAG: hypothetical protein GY769_03745 [bacterium]|nr:hypothetical protein [bacterium]